MNLPDSANSDQTTPHVVVLGAGMCGLYAARRLAAAGVKVTVIEKADRPGGLAASMEREGNFFDLGVKHLHAHDAELFEDIRQLMGAKLLPVPLRALIRFGGGFRKYPLKFLDLLLGIPPWTLAWILGGLGCQQLRNRLRSKKATNAEEALIELYGAPLYRYFFRDFTHRYWGRPPTELSAIFVWRKMPRLGAVDLIRQAFAKLGMKAKQDTEVENALAEETLYYSKRGALAIPEALVTQIESDGGEVRLGMSVESVEAEEGRLTAVVCGAGQERIACDHVINTIPISTFVSAIRPAAPPETTLAAERLKFRPLVVYGLVVKRRRVLDALYVYYRDSVFHRIAEPTQSGLVSQPPDHAVLLIEITCSLNDPFWSDEPSARERMLGDLEKERVVDRNEIVQIHHQCTPFGYPMFDLDFDLHLETVQSYLRQFGNVDSIGRQGGFCYPNMHQTMRFGADVADRLIAPTDNV